MMQYAQVQIIMWLHKLRRQNQQELHTHNLLCINLEIQKLSIKGKVQSMQPAKRLKTKCVLLVSANCQPTVGQHKAENQWRGAVPHNYHHLINATHLVPKSNCIFKHLVFSKMTHCSFNIKSRSSIIWRGG